jgi:PAS domain S-box-containing protein
MISANAAMTGAYDYREVARSVLIAVAASYVALDLAGRVTSTRGRTRLAWWAGGSLAMGIGIWEMHLKGMQAFHLPVSVAYHWPTALAALLLAIFASAVSLFVASRQKMGRGEAVTGSIVMGGGIAGLHYTFMAAMRLPAITVYSPLIVAISILLAVAFSLIALLMAFGLREEEKWTVWRRFGSAIVMGAAISAMHYTGMAAATFFPSSPPDLTRAVSITPLGDFGVVTVTLLVLLAAVITSSVDKQADEKVRQLNQQLERRVEVRTSQLANVNEELKKALEEIRHFQDQLRLVIDTIPAMVWSALPDGSVDFVNQRWLEYFGHSFDKIPGFAWTNKIYPADRASTNTQWRKALAKGEPFELETRLQRADGEDRLFVIRAVPLRDQRGNLVKWYGTKTDVEDRRRAQEELRESEARLRAFFKNSPNLILMKDPQGRYLYVNHEVERVFRITEEQIKGKRDDELFPQEQSAAYQSNDRQVLQAGIPMEFEEIFLEEDGPHTTIVQKFPLFNAEGAIYAIGGVATDITERIREEAALRYSEEKYRIVVETASDAVVSIDESGNILLANPATTTIFGHESPELIDQPLTKLMPEYLRELHKAGFQRYLDTGERHINWHGTELTGQRKNGEEFPVEVAFGELIKNGRRVFTGFIRDISDRKRAEEELRESEERFKNMADAAPVMIWASDPDKRCTYFNQQWLDFTGRAMRQELGDRWTEGVHEEDLQVCLQTYNSAFDRREPFRMEYRLRRADGQFRWIYDTGAPRFSPAGEFLGYIGSCVDITERKRAELALREAHAELARVTRIAALGELTATIAHEINQPLGAVVTNGNAALRWLAVQPSNLEETREAVERTIREANRASDVIAKIRVLLQKRPLQTERLDMNEVMREVLTLADSELLAGGVSVQMELAPDAPTVLGDRVQLQQVMLNLIRNGIEALSAVTEGPRELFIKLAKHPDGLLIEVHDSGIGVDPEQADRIFESFFTTKRQGIGMGLSVSRSIVEAHGGRLWFTPGSHRGALFQFTVPKAD